MGGLPLVPLLQKAQAMGDESHNHNNALTSLFVNYLTIGMLEVCCPAPLLRVVRLPCARHACCVVVVLCALVASAPLCTSWALSERCSQHCVVAQAGVTADKILPMLKWYSPDTWATGSGVRACLGLAMAAAKVCLQSCLTRALAPDDASDASAVRCICCCLMVH